MLKKVLIIFAVLVVTVLVAAGAFFLRYRKMSDTIRTEYSRMTDIDPARIADGTYEGSFGDFLVLVDLRATVADQRITGIDIVNQKCGPGYEALETIDRILAAQNPKVDAVTGATGSSMCIMIAASKALEKGTQ